VKPIGWDIDPQDWKLRDAAKIQAFIENEFRHFKSGRRIVLFHDVQPATVQALPKILEFLQKENVRITTLQPAQVSRLGNYPSPKVREIARKLGGQGMTEDRQKVFKDYHDEALAGGDATQGKAVFEKNCSTCHEVGGIGHAVGPNLAAMVNRGAEAVLYNVIAPNAEVDPRFLEYVVLTNDGQVMSGVIAGETSTAVTLRGPEDKTTTILRVDVDDIHTTGKSLMPEGFEKTIDKKAMANLITFLQQSAGSQGAKK